MFFVLRTLKTDSMLHLNRIIRFYYCGFIIKDKGNINSSRAKRLVGNDVIFPCLGSVTSFSSYVSKQSNDKLTSECSLSELDNQQMPDDKQVSILASLLYQPIYLFLEMFYLVFSGLRPRKEVKGNHILVTGSAEGIGEQFARQLAAMGNIVHCLDINEDVNNNVVENLNSKGLQAFAYTCDVTNWDELKTVAQTIADKGYDITYLINNAGICYGRSITSLTHSQLQYNIQINLISYLWTVKLFLPKMKELNRGHIVNVSSVAGLVQLTNSSDYSSAKAGSIHLSNQLRYELINTNISVTAVCPSFVSTRMINGLEEGLKKGGVCVVTPEECVEQAIMGIQENKDLIVIPKQRLLKLYFLRCLPKPVLRAYQQSVVKKSVKSPHIMIGQRMTEKIK